MPIVRDPSDHAPQKRGAETRGVSPLYAEGSDENIEETRRRAKNMAKRQVDRSGKASDGDITRLCGSWGSVSKSQAINEIDSRTHSYVVRIQGTREVDVLVKNGPTGKYLTTSPDGRTRNNLSDLPDC